MGRAKTFFFPCPTQLIPPLQSTINSMWNEIDVLLTANPDLLLQHPSDKLLIKYETEYNKNINSLYSIKNLKELEEILNNFIQC